MSCVRTAGPPRWSERLISRMLRRMPRRSWPDRRKRGTRASRRHALRACHRYGQEVAQAWRDDPGHDLAYPYYGFEAVDLTVDHGDLVEGHYSRWLAERHPDPDRLRGPENALPGDVRVAPQAWRTAVPEELYSTRYIEEHTIDRLNGFARKPRHPLLPLGKLQMTRTIPSRHRDAIGTCTIPTMSKCRVRLP